MKINIVASSTFQNINKIIEVNYIDEAIQKLRTDKELVKSVIDEDITEIKEDLIPDKFVLKTFSCQESCEYEIEIYDYYRE